MKKLNVFYRFMMCAMLIVMLVGVSLAPVAYGNGSVGLKFPVDGVEYRIYFVGGFDDGAVIMNPGYEDIDLDDPYEAAVIVDSRIRSNGEAPYATDIVEGGFISFDHLPDGVYLVTGDSFQVDGVLYWPIPCLVAMPQHGHDSLRWDVTVEGKHDSVELMDISVLKVWKGDTENVRPTQITVQLMRNGDDYGDPVILNRDNSWRYTWTDLPSTDVWYVREVEIPQFYVSNTVRVENTFVIENTRLVPPPTVPPHIPQTGQLWWPVYALVCFGMGFVIIGLIRRRKSEENA